MQDKIPGTGNVQIFVHATTDMTEACVLLYHEGFTLMETRAEPIPDRLPQDRKPRCTWLINCPSEDKVNELLEEHGRLEDGIEVGAKKYDAVRKMVVRGMQIAWRRIEG